MLMKFCATPQWRLYSILFLIVAGLTITTIGNLFWSLKYSMASLASSNKKSATYTSPNQPLGMRASAQLLSAAKISENRDPNGKENDAIAYDTIIRPKIKEILTELEKQAALIDKLQNLIQNSAVAKGGDISLSEWSRQSTFAPKRKKKEKIASALRHQAININQLYQVLEVRKNNLLEILGEVQGMQVANNFPSLSPVYSIPSVENLNQELDVKKNAISEISEELQVIQNGYKIQTHVKGHSEPTFAPEPLTTISLTDISEVQDSTKKNDYENSKLSGYADSDDPLLKSDIPVFWHIPKAGGSTVKDIMGACHRFVLASEAGILEGHADDTTLAVVKIGGDPVNGIEPSRFVNVDTTHLPGLEKAKRLGLVKSGLADVIVVRHLFEAESLFNPQQRGRVFAVFRHPVERATSMFNYIKLASWEPTYNTEIATMTLEEYVKSRYMEQDWLTRYLSNTMQGPLSEEHFELAKNTVRRKVMVGLLEKKKESMERFEKFFGWKYKARPKVQEMCRGDYLLGGANGNNNAKEQPQPGSHVYEMIVHMNKFDIRLYTFIKELFDDQAYLTSNVPDGYRLVGATCCECDKTC